MIMLKLPQSYITFFFIYTKLHHLSNYISFGQLQPIPEVIMTPTRTQKEIEIII